MALLMPSSIYYKFSTKQSHWNSSQEFIPVELNPYFIRNKLNSTNFKTKWHATVGKEETCDPTKPLLYCLIYVDY